MQKNRLTKGRTAAAAAVLALGLAGVTALGAAVAAPAAAPQAGRAGMMSAAAIPTNVLIFPADIAGAKLDGDDPAARAARDAQEIITDAVRSKMSRAGVGLYVYSRRLPSVQRAVSEASLKADEAAGPGDDDQRALRLAQLVGASEFVVLSVENYKYDPATRTATFTLSGFRRSAEDGTPLGTVSESATGVAPEDVAAPRQQGSAVARAADVVADQVVTGLFPMPKVATKDAKKK
jgi:hypothetical protein